MPSPHLLASPPPRKGGGGKRGLRGLRARLSLRRAVKSAAHALRSCVVNRPRVGRAVLVLIAGLLLFLFWRLLRNVVGRACDFMRARDGLCRINPFVDVNKGPPGLFSEGEVANDGDVGMLDAAGRDMFEEHTGVAWLLARATPPPPDRSEVRIAYFVQIGADSVKLLPRLFSRLHHPDNVYVLHMDSKIDQWSRSIVMQMVADNEHYRKNMHFLPSEMVTYKGISMVMNTLAGMTLALKKDPRWDYFINISGADYPLLTPTTQRQLLARPGVANGRLNFFSLFPEKEWVPYANFRVKYQYWDPAIVGFEHPKSRLRRLKGFRVNPLEPYRRYKFVKAEAWMILSQPFCKFLIRSDFAKKMLMNHAHVLSAPEHYFANVMWNHPLWRKTLVRDAFRKVVWHHKHHRGGQHPYVLDKTTNDPFEFWTYVGHTRSLFARKFSKAGAPIQDRIDFELSGAMNPPNSDTDSLQKVAVIRQRFFDSIAAHFDYLTRKTLFGQGEGWPVQ